MGRGLISPNSILQRSSWCTSRDCATHTALDWLVLPLCLQMHKWTLNLLRGCTSIMWLSPVLALAFSSHGGVFIMLWAPALWLFTAHLCPFIPGCFLTEGAVFLGGAGIAHSVKKIPSLSLQSQGIFWKGPTNRQALFKMHLGPSVTKVLCFVSLACKGLSTDPCALCFFMFLPCIKRCFKEPLCPNLKKSQTTNQTKKIVFQS